MKKQNTLLILAIVILLGLVVGVFGLYNRYYLPSKQISANYVEVYREVEADDNYAITISTINQHLIIKSSEDEVIKVMYYQKTDNSNTFDVNNSAMKIEMVEKVENLENLFYKSEKALDTITISLPASKTVNVRFHTIDGSGEFSDMNFASIAGDTINGSFSLQSSNGKRLDLSSNAGEIKVSDSTFVILNATTVTGPINIDLNNSLEEYDYSLSSRYGNLLINQQPVIEEIVHPADEENEEYIEEKQLNEVVSYNKKNKQIIASTIRNTIDLRTVEPETEEITESAN